MAGWRTSLSTQTHSITFGATPIRGSGTAWPAQTESRSRIPSLDGLRAVSIGIVLLAHAAGTVNLPYMHVLYSLGSFGVKIFFVISGFLITTLLLNEESRQGRISIAKFYFRRAFRIWPVAYSFILLVAILNMSGKIFLPVHNLWFAITFTINHAPRSIWWTGHLWSLAVEEQFYLIWPVVFLLCGSRGRVLSCIAIILIAPASRILAYVYAPAVYDRMAASLLFVGDGIAIGCLLALLGPRLRTSPGVNRTIGSKSFFVIPIVSVAMYATLASQLWPKFHFAIGDSISLICIGATLWRVAHWEDSVSRILNTRLLVFLGTLSYSLYIWQQIFLINYPAWIYRFPQNLIAAIMVAVLSYRLIERPFFRLRDGIEGLNSRRATTVSSVLMILPGKVSPIPLDGMSVVGGEADSDRKR